MSSIGQQKLLSGASQTLGPLAPQGSPLSLDPSQYQGCLAISNDGVLYVSDGVTWKVPADDSVISRPIALEPTTAIEQTQLRVTPFYSAKGYTQSGLFFEVSLTGDFENDLFFSRNIVSDSAAMYQVLTPEDGLQPEQSFFWRAAYKGRSDNVSERQSEFSLPIQQTFPKLITTPSPITREGATTGVVQITPFESPFNLSPVQVQVEYVDANTDALIVTQTIDYTSSVSIPSQIAEGVAFKWRARYSGRVGLVGTATWSGWSAQRTAINGARSMLLRYDLVKQGSRTITLPIGMHLPAGGVVNVTVQWGDGTSNTYTTGGAKTHTYAVGTGDNFDVTISGQLSQYGGNVSQPGLTRINSIGMGLGLTSLRGLFRGTNANLEYCSPALPPQVTDLSEAFYGVGATSADFSQLDVSNVTNMFSMFHSAAISPNISGWDVSKVQNMSYMFYNYTGTSSLSGWNTSSVTNMSYMFAASPYNQPGLNTWDVSKVTDMSYMFWNTGASTQGKFNQPLNNWNTGSVTTMKGMFGMQHGRNTAQDFNQDIGSWDVSKVTDMSLMFGILAGIGGGPGGGTGFAFNNGGSPSINNWNTASVTTMRGMFGDWDTSSGVTAGFNYWKFNQPITGWKTGNVTDMSYMFSGNSSFQQTLTTDGTGWDVSKVTSMQGMFRNSNYNQPISGWVLHPDVNLYQMFFGSPFNSAININTSAVKSFRGMFYGAATFNQTLAALNTSSATNMSQMFLGALAFNRSLDGWNTSNVTDMSEMFATVPSFQYVAMSFNQPLNILNVSNVTNMYRMFAIQGNGVTHPFNQPLDAWDVSKVNDMRGMFGIFNGGGTHRFNQDISAWKLNPSGVLLDEFFSPIYNTDFSTVNYSKLLAGWANTVAQYDGPFTCTFSAKESYTNTEYFPTSRFKNAYEGRAFLVGANKLSITGSSNANANGAYTWIGATQVYDNDASDWYFVKSGTDWLLKDGANVTQAQGTGTTPQKVTTWTGVLAGATVLRTGAVWTITGDTAA